jgi:hypothetical protein
MSMGVYIKGIEMPTSCPCELLGIGYDLFCNFAGGIPARVKEYYECCQNGTRPSWCPLVPVPPHGRLIDADALKDVQQADADFFKGSSDYGEKCRYDEAINAVANIVNAPTIIPAEEGLV